MRDCEGTLKRVNIQGRGSSAVVILAAVAVRVTTVLTVGGMVLFNNCM